MIGIRLVSLSCLAKQGSGTTTNRHYRKIMTVLLFSYLLDLIFGDPEGLPHPIRAIGKLILFLERRLRGKGTEREERLKGLLLAILVVGVTSGSVYTLLYFAKILSPSLYWVVAVYFGYTALSIKDLRDKAKAIICALEKKDLGEARERLSMIVGRDTERLNEDQITRATVESIAENTNDGIIAPLFYLILGGPTLAFAYKAINTLDSMLGYKNETYLHFGWASARLDDLANFIPARISGFLISLASLIRGNGLEEPFEIMLQDGRKHPSPNSGLSEAAMAGALGIRLGGPVSYQGKVLHKPYLGRGQREVKTPLIDEALGITMITSILMISMGIAVRWIS